MTPHEIEALSCAVIAAALLLALATAAAFAAEWRSRRLRCRDYDTHRNEVH